MPWNIPIAIQPSSILLSDPPASGGGGIFNLWKPKKGPWKITIPLSTDATCSVRVLVELLQDQSSVNKGLVVIASQSFTINSVPTNYEMTISEMGGLLSETCSTGGLQVRVTPTCEILCPNCPNPLPKTLTATVTSTCSNCDGLSITITNNGGNVWSGYYTDFNGNLQALVVACGNPPWTFMGIFCNPSGSGSGVSTQLSCDPLHFRFVDVPIPLGDCNGQKFTLDITA